MNNPYDGDNAWTDASGALHLQITRKSGRWSCAEAELTRSLGYGTYIVVVSLARTLGVLSFTPLTMLQASCVSR